MQGSEGSLDLWCISHKDLIYRDRGLDGGFLANQGDDECPNIMGYDWRFYPGDPCGGVWTDAGNSLTVNCVNTYFDK